MDVAIHLTATNGVSSVLAVLSKEVLGLNASVANLTKGFNGLKIGIIGAVTAAAGLGAFKVFEKFEEAGEKLVHVKTVFEAALPVTERMADMAQVTAAAWKEAGSNLNSSVTDNIEAMHDLYNVTQSIPHAMELLPSFNLLRNSMDAVADGHNTEHSSNASVGAAVRALEMSGHNTVEELKNLSHNLQASMVALRGRVTGSAMLTQIGTAGDSRYGFSPEFLTYGVPAMMATGLGNRTGQALNAISNNIYGGVSSSEMQMRGQIKWGLQSDEDRMDPKRKKPGFTVGTSFEAAKLRENPYEWANDYRKFLHDVKHVNVDSLTEMQKVIGEIGRGNKLLKAGLDEILLPPTNRQLGKEITNEKNVAGDATNFVNENDPKAVRAELHKQFENAMAGVGEQFVQPMMDNIIKPLTAAMKDVSQFAAANPAAMAVMGKGLLGLAAGLTALGIAMVTTGIVAAIGAGGTFAALAVGVVALAAAVALFAPGVFQAAADQITKFYNFLQHPTLTAFDDTMLKITNYFVNGILGLTSQIAPAIKTACDGIGAAIANALSSALSSVIGRLGIPGIGKALEYFNGSPKPADAKPEVHGSLAAPVPPKQKMAMVELHHTSTLDGKVLSKTVTRYQTQMASMPNAIGGVDDYGSYVGPGTTMLPS
ncbi:MAG: hypothetical protein ABSA13_12455 [Beijerinckiaceae bacterium]|jgi:hypothetical protein